ncbi:hypothetical protein IQ62_39790 [Streptomyces scabiei]|nr:hypothetical protein IQ62_39790 [Streptomyces scabiei]
MLILAIVLMAVATTPIGTLPTHDTVGALTPWLPTFVRVRQGLSAGGEFGGRSRERRSPLPPGRRGLYGSWQPGHPSKRLGSVRA